jgi:drug/metabolite transporter (DMT)-like permease
MNIRSTTSYFILGLGVVAVSFAGVLIKLCNAPFMIIASYRLGIASLFFLSVTAIGRLNPAKIFTRQEFQLAILSGVFLSVHFATWIASLKHTSVASSVVFVATSPIFVALGAHFILREKISSILVLGIFVAIIGGMIIGLEDLGKSSESILGDLLALAGAIAAAGYFLIGRHIRTRIATLPYVTVVYTTTAIILIITSLFMGVPFTGYSKNIYLLLILIAFVPQVIGHTSINWSLRYLSVTFVAVVVLGEPIGATILAYFIMGEAITWLKIIGMTIILLGVYFSLHAEIKIGFKIFP